MRSMRDNRLSTEECSYSSSRSNSSLSLSREDDFKKEEKAPQGQRSNPLALSSSHHSLPSHLTSEEVIMRQVEQNQRERKRFSRLNALYSPPVGPSTGLEDSEDASSNDEAPVYNKEDEKFIRERIPWGALPHHICLPSSLSEHTRARPRPQAFISWAALAEMTNGDVREYLERSYEHRQRVECYFNDLIAAQPSPTSFPTRWERLVNISRLWDDLKEQPVHPTEGVMAAETQHLLNVPQPNDVLLPCSLIRPVSHSETSDASSTPPLPLLRPHQLRGIRFLWQLLVEGPVAAVPGVGAILAHSMGLGKTSQVIIFLHLFFAAYRNCCGQHPRGPEPRVAVVVPKSVLGSWMAEMDLWSKHFKPSHRLQPICLRASGARSDITGGQQREREVVYRTWRKNGGLLLIHYEALVRVSEAVKDDDDNDEGSTSNYHQKKRKRQESRLRQSEEEGQDLNAMCEKAYAHCTELVVCDEAHRLKRTDLQSVQAIRSLRPLRRLLLTGTPLQNHLSEYWSMVELAVPRFFDNRLFRQYFIRPIESSTHPGASIRDIKRARERTFTLISELSAFVQRIDRTPLKAELPPLHEYVVTVQLSPLQRSLYIQFLEILLREGATRGEKLFFLPAIFYAGRIAAHPHLVFETRLSRPTWEGSSSRKGMASKQLHAPYSGLLSPPKGYYATPAISKNEPKTTGKAPVVQEISKEVEEVIDAVSLSSSSSSSSSSLCIQSPATTTSPIFESPTLLAPSGAPHPTIHDIRDREALLNDGPKIIMALRVVAEAIRRGEKVLFFSLSTRLLDFVEEVIAEVNTVWTRPSGGSHTQPYLLAPIRTCRIDGSCSSEERIQAIRNFSLPDAAENLFLLSTRAGGVGITITAATRVVLLDTSFNPADDHQAIGRAYRYGQKKPVYVYRLVARHTLEELLFHQKLSKEWLSQTVVDESHVQRSGLNGLRLKEIFHHFHQLQLALQREQAEERQGSPRKKRGKPPLKEDPTALAGLPPSLAEEDDVLAVLAPHFYSAVTYGSYLEEDKEGAYGLQEKQLYERYRQAKYFHQGDALQENHQQASSSTEAKNSMRIDVAAALEVQGKSLSDLIEQIVAEQAGSDPSFEQLMKAMNVRIGVDLNPAPDVDSSAARQANVLEEGAIHRSAIDRHALREEKSAVLNAAVRTPPAPPPRAPVIMLLDEETEEDGEDVSVLAALPHTRPTSGRVASEFADQNFAVQPLVNPQLYHSTVFTVEDNGEE